MTELIDWVETQGQENLKFILSCLETLLKECNTTLTILLAGVGTTAAYAIKQLNQSSYQSWLLFGVTSLCLYFLFLCGILIIKCMKIDEIQVPTNEPANLYQKDYTALQIRESELKNTQSRINKATARNLIIAEWLNKIRMLILAPPILFIVAVAFYLWLDPFSLTGAVEQTVNPLPKKLS